MVFNISKKYEKISPISEYNGILCSICGSVDAKKPNNDGMFAARDVFLAGIGAGTTDCHHCGDFFILKQMVIPIMGPVLLQ